MIDFTNCMIDRSAHYGGSDQKRGIIFHNKRYMLKMSDRIDSEKRNSLNNSYSNSVFSEYICCHILNASGYAAQDTLLGNLTIKTASADDKIVPVVACENFVKPGCELIEFKDIANALLPEKPGKIPRMEELYAIFCTPNVYFDANHGKEALDNYWDLFIWDSLFGNFDRHAHNWGYLLNQQSGELLPAPIYDCGSCLYPQLADDSLDRIMNTPEEVQMRIEKFPTAALEDTQRNKVNYKAFIQSFCNPDCTAALLRVFPHINLKIISNVINSVPELTPIRREFYKTMLHARYEKILVPAYEQARKPQNHDLIEMDDFER